MNFKIQIENFEGPIDVLLQMIEKRKMLISDVSLADITDDYIHFVRSLEYENISNTTHFIFVASVLTLIKSKTLLPNLELTEEEEGDIEDLKKRIEMFQVYQHLAQEMKGIWDFSRKIRYPKTPKKMISFRPTAQLNLSQMKQSLDAVFAEIPQKENTKKEASVRIAVHIEEMMLSLEERIRSEIKTNFTSFIRQQAGSGRSNKEMKVYHVVGFLAMLELVKNGVLHVLQSDSFSEIALERTQ